MDRGKRRNLKLPLPHTPYRWLFPPALERIATPSHGPVFDKKTTKDKSETFTVSERLCHI
jgi:hypothetical protein